MTATPTGRFELSPRGPWSLSASARFLEGFAPAARERAGPGDHMHLAFVPEGGVGAAGVCLRSGEDGEVAGEVYGEVEPTAVAIQVERILSLDVDGSGFPDVGRRDPVIGALQERFPGLRPVCFHSPYEAAAWALISNRMRIVQAAGVKARMAVELGTAAEVHGSLEHAFPGPKRLRRLEGFSGLSDTKIERLRALALAAEEGWALDAGRLRSLPAEEALVELRALPGIGPFSAELVLLRGAGEPDRLPAAEPRLRRAVARAYGLEAEPADEELESMAEAWRPYRTWVAFLLRAGLEEDTGEIAGGVRRRRSRDPRG